MKQEEFEQKLQRQSLRQVPTEWRKEILADAQSAVRHSSPVSRCSILSTLHHQLSTLLSPRPRAWAGLAAAWVLIVAVNFSIRDEQAPIAQKAMPPSQEALTIWQQQKTLLAELVGSRDLPAVDRLKNASPSPHGQRQLEFLNA